MFWLAGVKNKNHIVNIWFLFKRGLKMKITLDKIVSSTRNVSISKNVVISDRIEVKEGSVIVVKALEEKANYGEIELIDGRMAKICKGDIIAGVLGERKALRAYVGIIPKKIRVGDTLHILNLGGVLGKCISENPDLGHPVSVEVLGSVLVFPSIKERKGISANIKQNAIKGKKRLEHSIPLIIIVGSCMDSGKTSAACEIIKFLNKKGYRIGALKLTGISLRRDILKMQDYGAVKCLDFTDAGFVSTSNSIMPAAKGLITELNNDMDAIVIELGDGILGEYGVQSILRDKEIVSFSKANVFCATDSVSAYGGAEQFKKYGLKIDVISGPATDTHIGVNYIEKNLGVSAINARTDGEKLGEFIEKKVFGK